MSSFTSMSKYRKANGLGRGMRDINGTQGQPWPCFLPLGLLCTVQQQHVRELAQGVVWKSCKNKGQRRAGALFICNYCESLFLFPLCDLTIGDEGQGQQGQKKTDSLSPSLHRSLCPLKTPQCCQVWPNLETNPRSLVVSLSPWPFRGHPGQGHGSGNAGPQNICWLGVRSSNSP